MLPQKADMNKEKDKMLSKDTKKHVIEAGKKRKADRSIPMIENEDALWLDARDKMEFREQKRLKDLRMDVSRNAVAREKNGLHPLCAQEWFEQVTLIVWERAGWKLVEETDPKSGGQTVKFSPVGPVVSPLEEPDEMKFFKWMKDTLARTMRQGVLPP